MARCGAARWSRRAALAATRARWCARPPRRRRSRAASRTGVASWYGPGFHGRRTANGEVYDQYELTAAHRTLPLGTRVCVTNLDNGRSVEVRINDRGPFVGGRVIDLSYAAARVIGMIGPGRPARVRVEVLERRAAATRGAGRAVRRVSARVGAAPRPGAAADARPRRTRRTPWQVADAERPGAGRAPAAPLARRFPDAYVAPARWSGDGALLPGAARARTRSAAVRRRARRAGDAGSATRRSSPRRTP